MHIEYTYKYQSCHMKNYVDPTFLQISSRSLRGRMINSAVHTRGTRFGQCLPSYLITSFEIVFWAPILNFISCKFSFHFLDLLIRLSYAHSDVPLPRIARVC